MIRTADLVGSTGTDRAQVYMGKAARRRGMYETGIKIFNNVTGTWLKINVSQTVDEEGARWHFLHLLDRLQSQGWKLNCGRVDNFNGLIDDDCILTQALRSWQNAGRG